MDRKTQQLYDFVQDVHIMRSGRKLDDIGGEDGQNYVDIAIRWANMLFDELENKADWVFLRENDVRIGTAQLGARKISLGDNVARLIVDEDRPLKIMQGDARVSRYDVVKPGDLTKDGDALWNRCANTRSGVVFSKAFDETEQGGSIVADVLYKIPRLSRNNVEALTLVKPYKLVVIGVAKEATLPDMIQADITPSLDQRYVDLLNEAIAQNEATSQTEYATIDKFGSVRGVY